MHEIVADSFSTHQNLSNLKYIRNCVVECRGKVPFYRLIDALLDLTVVLLWNAVLGLFDECGHTFC